MQGGRPTPMWRCHRAVLAHMIREYPAPPVEKLEERFRVRKERRRAIYVEGLHDSNEDAQGRIYLYLSSWLPAMGSYASAQGYYAPPGSSGRWATQTWLDLERRRVKPGQVHPVTNGRIYGDAIFHRDGRGYWYIRKVGAFREVGL